MKLTHAIAIALLVVSGTASAGGYGRGYYHQPHYWGGARWVVPAVVAGTIVYAATRPTVVQAQPVYVERAPVYVPEQRCTPWRETMAPDGSITRERTCY